ncbi:DEAD/DEAH box helicase family protein [Clostridium estertheticum]|uniref:DEAD/DEAH box helicase family protein n=1 Tax=Clostridium estertheticum TaxID=238834 RepID=UPI001C0BABDA|nr:DEAD/DEAH box helicase family protein [Clostridium estertheticum]MBU3075614.1 DNA helicase [Clostridium estertheticum]MBU3164804.1 DNA helicase [Clostridium estertheticum]
MIAKRVSELITTDEVRTWDKGDIITIGAGTGAGKSFFVKTILYAFAKKNHKRILFLIHRTNCVDQFRDEIITDKKNDIIDIRTYQSLESVHNEGFDFSVYDYIVCDEFHYFLGDASYNKTTDISLERILSQRSAIRVFMSATGDYMKRYINNNKRKITINYRLPIYFDYIEKLSFYCGNDSLNKVIENTLKKHEKIILFIESAEAAYDLYLQYKKYALFNCSKSNKKYYKHVYIDKIKDMLKNEKFDETVLITTTCMDAGVNIKDTKVKTVVCDVRDVGVLIQCIGRKRLQPNDGKIHLYVKALNNQYLGGMKSQLKLNIKKADFLMSHNVKEYIAKFPRQSDYNNIVYADTVDEDDKSTHKINELMYLKCRLDIHDIDKMLAFGDYGYCRYLADKFGFHEDGIFEYDVLEESTRKDNLINYLDSVVGIPYFQVKDRVGLINNIHAKANRKQLKRLSNLNGALEELRLPFRIIEFSTTSIINGKKKRFRKAWRVEKLII